jgi:hypothetical protein
MTTCTNQALVATNIVTVPAWDIEIGDSSRCPDGHNEQKLAFCVEGSEKAGKEASQE